MWLFLLLACWTAPPVEAASTDEPIAASDAWTLHEAADKASIPWPPPALRLAVDKSARSLTVYSGASPLKRYRVGLGVAQGDKVQQGDKRTPDGRLKVINRNGSSQFHRFLGLNYPRSADADRGLKDALITSVQARAIRAADKAGGSDWDTPLGGAVGIHGGGSSTDWTWGCIAVSDDEIDELWAVVQVGTPVDVEE